MLPARRPAPAKKPSTKGPKIRFPAHLRWVRAHVCSVSDCNEAKTVAAHVRTRTGGGMGKKPPDWWVLSLCNSCHYHQHNVGESEFETVTNLDMRTLAIEFAKASPVKEVREMAGVRL